MDKHLELKRCIDSLDYVVSQYGLDAGKNLLSQLNSRFSNTYNTDDSNNITTSYVNTIPKSEEPTYPGDLEIEQRILSFIRWNAMAMVIQANRTIDGIGGHISSFASSACLYEVGFNHFFRGSADDGFADQVFFQGHVTPGIYSRSFLEGRFNSDRLHLFRQELSSKKGLSSYPHPYLMPDYWQFPTVSMGLGPILSIYQARFNRYLSARGLVNFDREPTVWSFLGDGECDEPETLGALSLASREKLDNLIFVINCNLQRLDGPVRGNGKIIQELESVFKGAGWNVIKLVWGSNWDDLLEGPKGDLLAKRMAEAVDGDYQKYSVEEGSYARTHFFGKYPELVDIVNHLTDSDLNGLLRGGHDLKKIYAAYKKAVDYKQGPTVILAKTIKGYGLGEAGEGKNISHQQKKMNEKELREFRDRFDIPISDEDVVNAPFFKPKSSSKEIKYLLERRKQLGGFLPKRNTSFSPLNVPLLSNFSEFLKGSSGRELSTTMAFVRLLSNLLKNKDIGSRIVPIIPDEARTFGMESMFRQIGIYSPFGQKYIPVDSSSILFYKEAEDGQILEEGINEAGSMCSFISAGTSYSTFNYPMIPFYIYYSMFGFQRIGDLAWLAGDMQARGFMLGGTAGRTTLNGEGLQHQDGHSLLLASTIPNLMAYDVSYAFEIAVIVQDGLKRMYQQGENIFYYLTLHNENYDMPAMPEGAEEGIINGMYVISASQLKTAKLTINLFGSGSIINEAISAQKILEERYNIGVTVWAVTNYKRLRNDTIKCERWNMLHPKSPKKRSFLQKQLTKKTTSHVAVSDYMRSVPDQISSWVPGGLFTLGTDGFGRSDSRKNLRRFFEVDKENIVVASLYSLAKKDKLNYDVVANALKDMNINPKKDYPLYV